MWGRLCPAIVGTPDDAVLFLYLNYVHNTYRMWQAGAVGAGLWADTLRSCGRVLGGLRRERCNPERRTRPLKQRQCRELSAFVPLASRFAPCVGIRG